MPSMWDSYYHRVSTEEDAAAKRASYLARTRENIGSKEKYSLSYKSVKVNGEDRHLVIVSAEATDTKTFMCPPGETVRCGSLIDYADYKWLVTELDAESEVYQKGTIRQCNYILRWNNKKGEIIERDCIIDDGTKYLTGEQQRELMSYGDSRAQLIIAKDEETAQLHRGHRFLIDENGLEKPLAFVLTKPNRISMQYKGYGVYRHMLTEDQFNPKADNAELMIADYYTDVSTSMSDSIEHEEGWI